MNKLDMESIKLDLTEFSHFKKSLFLDPVEVPPSAVQRNTMKRRAGDNRIIKHICELSVKEFIIEFYFSIYDVAAIRHLSGSYTESMITAEEYVDLERLLIKSGKTEVSLLDLRPTVLGIPCRFSTAKPGTILYRTKDQVFQEKFEYKGLFLEKQADIADLFDKRDSPNILIAGYFYFSDLQELLEVERPKGKQMIRFLRIFAHSKINDFYYHFFDRQIRACRFLMLENGDDLGSITMPMIQKKLQELE